jgi:hypothetical protein
VAGEQLPAPVREHPRLGTGHPVQPTHSRYRHVVGDRAAQHHNGTGTGTGDREDCAADTHTSSFTRGATDGNGAGRAAPAAKTRALRNPVQPLLGGELVGDQLLGPRRLVRGDLTGCRPVEGHKRLFHHVDDVRARQARLAP